MQPDNRPVWVTLLLVRLPAGEIETSYILHRPVVRIKKKKSHIAQCVAHKRPMRIAPSFSSVDKIISLYADKLFTRVRLSSVDTII